MRERGEALTKKVSHERSLQSTHHFSGQHGVLLASDQKVHSPAHGCGSEQGHHLFLAFTIQVHSTNLHKHTHTNREAKLKIKELYDGSGHDSEIST